MKNIISTRIGLLAAGLLLVALILPGSSDGQAAKKPPADSAASGKGATAKKPAVLVNLGPERFSMHKKTPAKKYVAFEYKDFKDKTGKAPTADTILTLYNGQRVSAQKHKDAVNNIEKALCAWGYSLRDSHAKPVVLSELISKKKDAHTPFVAKTKPEEKALSLLKSDFFAKEHALLIKRFPGTPDVVPGTLTSVSNVKSFEESFGDPSVVGVTLKTFVVLKGDQFGTSISAEARLTGSIFGHAEDVAVAHAELKAPRKGGLDASLKVTSLGTDKIALQDSRPKDWSVQDTFKLAVPPDAAHVKTRIPIGPFAVTSEFGLKGNISIPYFVGMSPGTSSIRIAPHVDATMFGEVVLDGDLLIAGARAGIRCSFVLLDDDMIAFGTVQQGSDAKGMFISETFGASNVIKALSGKVTVFLDIRVGIDPFSFTLPLETEIANFPGINPPVAIPFAGTKTERLVPIRAK